MGDDVSIGAVIGGVLVCAVAAQPDEPKWVPTASVSVGAFDERMVVRVDGTDTSTVRGQLRTFVSLGLEHPIATRMGEGVGFDGHMSVGVGPTFETGHWQILLREDATVVWRAMKWLTFRVGLGAGITVDTTASRRSFAELGLPLSVALFNFVELAYRPLLSIPLGAEVAQVLGDTRTLATNLALLPFEVQLRFRIRALGF
jgi:hypothetical protein